MGRFQSNGRERFSLLSLSLSPLSPLSSLSLSFSVLERQKDIQTTLVYVVQEEKERNAKMRERNGLRKHPKRTETERESGRWQHCLTGGGGTIIGIHEVPSQSRSCEETSSGRC